MSRNHYAVNMEEESLRMKHGGIIEEESLRRNHGGGIMEEESCRRDHGGGIMEEESWRRIMEEESWMRNHRGRIWEASRAIWTPRRHPGGTQEAPRRHPEAPRGTQRHPGGTQEVRGLWDSKTTILREREMKKVARPTVSRARERPDPHDLRSLSAKVDGQHSRKPSPALR